METQEKALASGIDIASKRQSDRISFSTLLGEDNKADEFLSSLTEFASSTPFGYDDLTAISKTLLAYGYNQDELLPLLEKIGDAGSAVGMSNADMAYVATALGRMRTTNKTTLEYLNPLLERGIDVWRYLAEASGKTKEQVQEMVSKGLVPGAKAAEAIADYMGYEYLGSMQKQSETYAGLVSTLEDAQKELANAMGEGYISLRSKGREEQIDFLSGESGELMQEAYYKMGQWKASLENLAEQYQRDALNTVMTGVVSSEFSEETQARLKEMYAEYTKLTKDESEEAGAKMGALLAEAQAIAINEYNASEGSQLALQSNLELAKRIREDSSVQESYWDAGYRMGQEFSKGLAAGISSTNTEYFKSDYTMEEIYSWYGGEANLTESQKELLKTSRRRVIAEHNKNLANSHATGISYVPYDNYPAILHQGERVLTASENRNYSKGTPINFNNSFLINGRNDIEEVLKEVARQIEQAFTLAE